MAAYDMDYSDDGVDLRTSEEIMHEENKESRERMANALGDFDMKMID